MRSTIEVEQILPFKNKKPQLKYKKNHSTIKNPETLTTCILLKTLEIVTSYVHQTTLQTTKSIRTAVRGMPLKCFNKESQTEANPLRGCIFEMFIIFQVKLWRLHFALSI